MSDSEGEVLVAEEATPESLAEQTSSDSSTTTQTQSSQASQENGALSMERTDSQPTQGSVSARGDVTSITHRAELNKQSTSHVSPAQTITNVHGAGGDHALTPQGAGDSSSSAINSTTPCTTTPSNVRPENSTAPDAGSTSSAEGPYSTSTPLDGQRFPNQLTRNFNRNRDYLDRDEEDEDWEDLQGQEGMGNVAGSIMGYSPLVYENNEEEGDASQLDELYVPISGYEVMEQRAKFTVFKLHVQKSASDGYFIFRRYTDFTRLNMKLKILYPCFRLALPPKRWFGNNFDPIFLEDRMLGLQAFLNNITGHKDIRKSAPVKEFLCLNDPPGPHDSIEESRVMVESLEEVAYNLRRDLADKDRLLRKRDLEITRLKARIQELENTGLPLENERVGTDQESESSTVEGDRRSCVEADLMDHGISDHANDERISQSVEGSLKVKIENIGKEPVKCGGMVGKGDTDAMGISESATPVSSDSR